MYLCCTSQILTSEEFPQVFTNNGDSQVLLPKILIQSVCGGTWTFEHVQQVLVVILTEVIHEPML